MLLFQMKYSAIAVNAIKNVRGTTYDFGPVYTTICELKLNQYFILVKLDSFIIVRYMFYQRLKER